MVLHGHGPRRSQQRLQQQQPCSCRQPDWPFRLHLGRGPAQQLGKQKARLIKEALLPICHTSQ